MLTKFDGKCFRCGKTVKAGKGDIQSVGSLSKKQRAIYTGGRWLIRCFACKGQGNEPIKIHPQLTI